MAYLTVLGVLQTS